MSNLSVRAFDEAQRRKQYAERTGIEGVAHMLRDIHMTQKHLSILAEYLWKAGVDPKYASQRPMKKPFDIVDTDVYEQFGIIGIQLLQLSGALGIDFVSLIKSEVERLELSVL